MTAGVIVVTLAQALLLPRVVRWAHLPADTGLAEERYPAETSATQAALDALPELAAQLGTDDRVLDRVRHEYEKHLRVLQAGDGDGRDEPALRHDQQYTELRLGGIARKRATVLRLRDQQRIDDTVLRLLQSRLDIEEVRLSRREVLD